MAMGKTTNPNSTKGVPSVTGAKGPAGATSSDSSGERKGRINGGVAMGMEDNVGSDKLFNTGRTSGVCYEHKRSAYAMEDKNQK
jgi:hypothetical protein